MALDLQSTGFSDALVVLGAAGLVIPAFARFKISPIIGFILVGVAVGPFGLGRLVPDAPWLYWVTISDPQAMAPFAELGIILLLFTIGLELSPRRLWAMRARIVGFGGGELLGSALLIALFFLALGNGLDAAAGLGLALALSSTALVLPMSGTTSPVGRLAFAMLLFEDLALVPIIFVLGAIGGSAGLSEFGGTLLAGIAVVVAMMVLGRVALPHLFAQAARAKSPELFVAATLLIVIVASAVTLAVGLSPIVGALIAGILLAETDYVHEIEHVVLPLRGLALGVFLLSVGTSIDLLFVFANLGPLFGALLAVLSIKAVVTAALLRAGGVRTAVAAETGFLMASPSETTLIVLAAAVSAGVIRGEAATFWQVVTALGLTLTPLLARLGRSVARRVEGQGEVEGEAAAAEPRVLVIGYGRVGRLVGEMLDAHAKRWVAIEADPDLVRDARAAGRPVRFGDARRLEQLAAMGVGHAPAVILTMDDAAQAVRLTGLLRAAYPALLIVARARDTGHAAALYKAGASDAVPENLESSLQLAENALVELGVAMGPVIASIHAKREELREAIKAEGELAIAPRLKLRSS